MNLNEEDIRNALKKYMDETGTKGNKMTKLCGMSSPSMFSQYISGVTQTLRAEYLIKFIYNAKIDLSKFLNQNIGNTKEELIHASDASIKYFNCLECIKKQKTIDELTSERDALRVELLELYRGKKENLSETGT